MIKKGYSRVMEKIKELRQRFSNAVTAGSRSGSGKLVMEFYDTMVQIWGDHHHQQNLYHLVLNKVKDRACSKMEEV